MYEDYFGLDRPPFKITPDTSLFYEGGKRGDILAALVYAIHRGEGIIKVVGEVGSGKTMLCRMLQLKLPEAVEIVYIANPSVSAEDILFVIAHELSIPVAREASKHEVMHLLQDYLLQRHMENKQVVLFVEEAQGMPLDTLEEIRLLSNLETDENKLLQIILFGQPELDQNLAQQSIRQLRERITHNFDLEPLTKDEIHSYLNFRMREVGYTGPELINLTVARKVELHSEGLLRRINIIADKILLSAFAEGTHNLNAKHVTAAVNDSTFGNTVPPRSQSLWWLTGLIVIALAYALYATQSQWSSILSVEIVTKQENAATNDKSITDISPETLETDSNQSLEARTDPATGSNSTSGSGQPILGMETHVATEQEYPETSSQTTQSVVDVAQEIKVVPRPVEQEKRQVADPERAEPTRVSAVRDPVLESTLDHTVSDETVAIQTNPERGLNGEYSQWLNTKLKESRDWLDGADRDSVSIQIMMRRKSAARELVYYLRNDWPLDISKTYLYEFKTDNENTYRVFYNEFDTLTIGKSEIEQLPEALKINSPYLNSVHRMRKSLL